MRTRLVVALLAVILVVYFVLLFERGLALLRSGGWVGIGLGIGVLLLPVVGAIVLGFELRFGFQTQRLARRLAEEPDAGSPLPQLPELPRRASGRIDRVAADAYFETVRTAVEARRGDWRGWYRLAQAYDLAGDRRRARESMREAIRLADSVDPPREDHQPPHA